MATHVDTESEGASAFEAAERRIEELQAGGLAVRRPDVQNGAPRRCLPALKNDSTWVFFKRGFTGSLTTSQNVSFIDPERIAQGECQ